MAKNISQVYLLSVPLEDDMKNTLYFANATSQHNYFANNIGKTYTNVSYQSETRTFRCPDQLDTVRQYNYIMWQNTAYSNKWFYAFIKKMVYVNDGYTDVQFEVDPLQTWMFDIDVKASFVEREHTNDDTVGSNTVPEDVEYGEYISNGFTRDNTLSGLGYIIQTTRHYNYHDDGTGQSGQSATNFGGVYNAGTTFYVESVLDLVWLVSEYDHAGEGTAITNVYVVPRALVLNKPTLPLNTSTDPSNENWWRGMDTIASYDVTVTKQTTLNGYTPRNKKLLTYPYNCLVVDNNNGSSNVYKYEEFSTANCVFEVEGVPTCGCSIKIAPKDYKGEVRYQQEGLVGGKFPTCGWVNDSYTNWLTQNAVNINLGAVGSIASIVGGVGAIATGLGATAGAGMIAGGLAGIGNILKQQYEHKIMPPTAGGNTNAGDITTCNDMNKFYFIKMSIKAEYARIIDDFFDMFGYKTCRVKVPNKAHRANWWYTKTIDANITGDIPNDELNRIKRAYNEGITFWRTPANFLNYSVNNGIV